MTPEVRRKVSTFFAAYPIRTLAPGELIARAGQILPGVLYLEEGDVIQYDITDDGRQVIVNTYRAPAFFPMSWAINDTPNVYFFEARTPVRARCAPAAEVVSFVRNEPDVLFNLLSRVYRGTDALTRKMTHAMGGKSVTLILFELITSCRRYGEQDIDSHTLKLTDQELADQTGLSRETVNRTLQHLRKEELVSLGYRTVIVPSLKRLEDALGNHV
jgi:CRP/FNR family transcriptional regulator